MGRIVRLNTSGQTWKYTLDVYKLRVCFWRKRRTNALGAKVKRIGINLG